MARVGIAINLIGVIVISLVFYFLGTAVLGIDTATLPTWAEVG
jgi:sodium-dependent dicarboxylate transporter 2/3/5